MLRILGLDRLRAWFASQERWVLLALLLAVAVRSWLAATDHSVFWPDEIYQSLEPAHRLAFGYGLMPWEFRDGARSWSFPALLVPPLKLLGLLGVRSGLELVVGARSVMVVLSTCTVVVGVEYAKRLGGRTAALIAAFALLSFPPLLVYSFRTLQESASAPLVLLAPLLLLSRTPKAARWAGCAVGLATLLRFQVALVGLVLLVELVVGRRWSEVRAYLGAGAVIAAASGLLDWLTWGSPFHAFRTYVEFNLIRGGASEFGVATADYYLRTLWTASGPALALFGAGCITGFRRARAATCAVLVFIAAHSAIPHKELRFVLPVLPLMLSIGSTGIAHWLDRTTSRPWAPAVVAGVVALGNATSAWFARYGDFGQYEGTPRANASVWHTGEEVNLLLAEAGLEPDLCGVLVLGQRAAFTGGFSYLHRNVPLIYRVSACQEGGSANYAIAAKDSPSVPPQFQLVRERGGVGLFKRSGACSSPPIGYDDMLDGADDMGLARAPIHQPNPHELRIDAGSSARAFVSGFGHGEHQGCRYMRWATDTSARMVFPLVPSDSTYVLSFTAQPFRLALPQGMHVSLNGRHVADFALSSGLQQYQVPIPQTGLRRGANTLDFGFDHVAKADGDDTRLLAALFGKIALAPVPFTRNLELGTAASRSALHSGFSGDEADPSGPFVWSNGPSSELSLGLPEAFGATALQLVASAYPAIAPVSVAVIVNGEPAGTLTVDKVRRRHALLLPAGLLKRGPNTVRLTYSRVAKPSEEDPSARDDRQLAVMYRTVVLAPLPADLHADLGSEEARRFQASGFGADEEMDGRSAVWSDGLSSRLWFRFEGQSADACKLELVTAAFAPALPLHVEVSLNGRSLGTFAPEADWRETTLPVPRDALAIGTNALELTYSNSIPATGASNALLESRSLALRLDTIDLHCQGANREP